jgi:hypothetical protein
MVIMSTNNIVDGEILWTKPWVYLRCWHDFYIISIGTNPLLYKKFIHACWFWSLVFMLGLSVESKTSGISSSSTLWQDHKARYKSSNEVNMTPRSLGTKPEKMKNFEDLVRKVSNRAGQGASSNSERNWRQGPTCRRGKDLEDSGTDTWRRR